MFDVHGLTSLTELSGAVAGAVVGEQSAHADTVSGEEVGGGGEESDSGFGLLIGQHLGKGQARVIVHGDMQRPETRMFPLAPQASIAASANFRKASHAFDIQVQQVAGLGML